MNPITIPYHLFIPLLTSLVLIFLIIFNWKRTIKRAKRKSIWISIILFLIIYAIIVGNALFEDIYCQWDLNKYDLNWNGIFETNEINPNQQAALERLVNDTGRNFSVFSGLFFSGIISLTLLVIGLGIEKYRKIKNS